MLRKYLISWPEQKIEMSVVARNQRDLDRQLTVLLSRELKVTISEWQLQNYLFIHDVEVFDLGYT